jgi:hypothetical protein
MTDLVTITPEEQQEIRRVASGPLGLARSFRITSPQLYDDAATRLKSVKGAQKTLADKKAALVNPINQALKAVRDLFRGPEAELDEAENLYKREMVAWSDECERQRQEAQRKLEETARREREALAAKAADAARRAEEARQAGQIGKADRLESKAAVLEDTAASVVAPIVQTSTPRVSGIARRENWYAVVTDLDALIKAVAAGTVPKQALQPCQAFLNNQAKALKKELNYPGVQAARETILASGSK